MNADVSSESEHLPIHVAKCEERYKTLECASDVWNALFIGLPPC